MNLVLYFLLMASVLGLPLIIYRAKKKHAAETASMPQHLRKLLEERVLFYRQLDPLKKTEFEKRAQRFLDSVKITGVRTEVEELDRLLVAAGAIIPIFGFPEWEYINLNEVLLYPGAFTEGFSQEDNERNVLGMVGSGAMQNVMILSKMQLRSGFENVSGKENTAIHEFVHLIDKTDGAVDGIPELLVAQPFILPWLNKIQEMIGQIMENKSDINPYGATNPSEFFAVAAEYFFKRPDLLQNDHPELYDMLAGIFKQDPAKMSPEAG
jgi:MtfA peptidase